jgi:hypothetical protein
MLESIELVDAFRRVGMHHVQSRGKVRTQVLVYFMKVAQHILNMLPVLIESTSEKYTSFQAEQKPNNGV